MVQLGLSVLAIVHGNPLICQADQTSALSLSFLPVRRWILIAVLLQMRGGLKMTLVGEGGGKLMRVVGGQ